jgi:hypothetical protein
MPLLVLSINYISQKTGSDFVLFGWCIICFFLPFFISTVDLSYIRNCMGEHMFKIGLSKEVFRNFFFPAWIRMVVYFISGSVSVIFFTCLA